MKLLASGCSLIYGSELSDEGTGTGEHSNQTYPALLAKHLDLEYECVACPGYGNDSITRSIIEHCSDNIGFVVVNWSYFDRYEYCHRENGWQNLGAVTNTKHPCYHDLNILSKAFFAYLSPDYTYYKYLAEIVLLQGVLQNKKIPYLFTTTESGLFEYDRFQKCRNLLDTINFDQWYMWIENNKKIGFCEWASKSGFAIGPESHPLEEAHQAAFELIKEKVKTYYDNSNRLGSNQNT